MKTGGPFGLSWRTRPIWLWKRPALMAAMLTRSSERCPRRRLNALRSRLVGQCLSKMAEGSRRFPPPWRADKIPGGYVVRDANGQALAYVYSRDSEAEALQAKVR